MIGGGGGGGGGAGGGAGGSGSGGAGEGGGGVGVAAGVAVVGIDAEEALGPIRHSLEAILKKILLSGISCISRCSHAAGRSRGFDDFCTGRMAMTNRNLTVLSVGVSLRVDRHRERSRRRRNGQSFQPRGNHG